MENMLKERLPELNEYLLIAKPKDQPAKLIGSYNHSKKAIQNARKNFKDMFWYILNKHTLETIAEKDNALTD